MEGAWKAVMRQKITVKLPECGNDATRYMSVVRLLVCEGGANDRNLKSLLSEVQ